MTAAPIKADSANPDPRVLTALRQMPVAKWIPVADRDPAEREPWCPTEGSPLTLVMMRILYDQGRIDIAQRRRGDRLVQLARRRQETDTDRPLWFGPQKTDAGAAGRVR